MGEVSARRLRLRGQYTEARCSRCESCRGQRARAEYTFVRSRAEARERVCLRELWVSSPGARAPDASTVEPSRALRVRGGRRVRTRGCVDARWAPGWRLGRSTPLADRGSH